MYFQVALGKLSSIKEIHFCECNVIFQPMLVSLIFIFVCSACATNFIFQRNFSAVPIQSHFPDDLPHSTMSHNTVAKPEVTSEGI